jgi:hypothetical protein
MRNPAGLPPTRPALSAMLCIGVERLATVHHASICTCANALGRGSADGVTDGDTIGLERNLICR